MGDMGDLLPLPQGVTGFCTSSEAFLPTVPFKRFKRAVHGVALALSAEVTRIESAEGKVEPNYHVAELHTCERRLVVLGHVHFPLVALADTWPTTGKPLAFTDASQLHKVLWEDADYRVLPATALRAPPEPRLLQNLSSAEHRQIQRWKPGRLGDLIFNCWD